MGFDLASLNIQRGRDHGLAPYNTVREHYGLKRKRTWAEITKDTEVQKQLKAAYKSVDDIDMWVGALAEDHYKNAQVGQLNFHIIKDQFQRLRDGDSFFYENSLPPYWIDWVNQQTLKRIIVRNTSIGSRELPNNVFFLKNGRR